MTVCTVCNDTHEMILHRNGDEQVVMCTSCPTPCNDCRQGASKPGTGLGPYCETTPCKCKCHRFNRVPAAPPVDPIRESIALYLEHLAREPIGTLDLTGERASTIYGFVASWVRNKLDEKWAEEMRKSGALTAPAKAR